MIRLSISFMCCDLKGGRVDHIRTTHSPLHSHSSPLINTRVLTGGSRSCNTTAISGLWNGGGTGGGGIKENKGEGSDWEGGMEGRGAGRLSLNLQLAAAVQTGFMVIALAAGHNPQHQGFS